MNNLQVSTIQPSGQPIPFVFQDIKLKEACWIGKDPYFTRRAIGEFLEYSKPRQAIEKIIKRNSYIEDPRWTSVVPIAGTTDGKKYKTRVYNPIGLQLIIFESRQPKAKAYKIMVAHFVYAFMKGEIQPPKDLKTHRLFLQCKEALRMTPYHDRPTAIKYIADQSGKSVKTIYGLLRRIEKGATSADRRHGHHKGRHYFISDATVAEIERLCRENPRITAKEVIGRLPGVDCFSQATVHRIKRRVKEQLKQNIIKRLEAAASGKN